MSMYPDPTAADVAARIGIVADTRVQACINAAHALWADDVDMVRLTRHPDAWTEAITQLAVKIYEAGTRGMSQYDDSGWEMPAPAATSGLRRSVLGLISPCLAHPAGFA